MAHALFLWSIVFARISKEGYACGVVTMTSNKAVQSGAETKTQRLCHRVSLMIQNGPNN